MPRWWVELLMVVVVGIGYTGGGGGVGTTAGMTVYGTFRPVKISRSVEEHAEWVHVAGDM